LFPSDHGVVFFGLSAVIYRTSPPLGIGAFIWATAIASLFDDVHELGRGLMRVVLHHDPFAGS